MNGQIYDFSDVDPDTIALLIAEQRVALEQQENQVLTSKLALESMEEAAQLEKDRRMAKSIMVANIADAMVIDTTRQEVEQEFDTNEDDDEDRALRNAQSRPENQNNETLSKLTGAYISEEAGKAFLAQTNDTQTEFYWQWGTETGLTVNDIVCVACGENKKYFEAVTMTCSHSYCGECIRDLFASSFKDESLFPPRCCRQAIPTERVDIFLTKDIKVEFSEKQIEYGTQNRTYCHHKPCSKFIPTNESNHHRYVSCSKCQRLTCKDCKQEQHGDQECPRDEETEEVLRLAQGEGWRRCNRCRTMVELNTGCNHITCNCGNEFCYVCGVAPWKSCGCPQWDDNMLLERAERIVRRQGAAGEVNLQVQVQEAARQLVENHNCDHARFQFVRGRFQCDECHDWLPSYIFRCQQCRIDVCNRCRRNRQR